MVDFLSDAWITALGSAASSIDISSDVSLKVRQTIHDTTDDTEVCWHVSLEAGKVEVSRGPGPEPDVGLVTDRATADGIHRGEISAQRAFLDGRIQILGDITALIRHQEVLAAVAPMMGLT